MTDGSELCPTYSKGHLRPAAESATAGESIEPVGEISDIHDSFRNY